MFGFFKNRSQKQLLDSQNDLIEKHCDEVQNMYRQMRGWRHDYRNHLLMIQNFLEADQFDKCREYVAQLGADLQAVDTVLKTGNVMLDAILNSKLSLAESRNIKVKAKASVPGSLKISDVDLCVLVGNLLDNAIEACSRTEERPETPPFLRVYIGMKGTQLYICITNTVFGRAKQVNGKFVTSKTSSGHGLGLMRIDKICQKYDGYIHRGSEEGAFSTEILLPND